MKLQTIFSGEHFTDRAKEAKFQPPWWAQILLFVAVFMVSGMPQSIVVGIVTAVNLLTDVDFKNVQDIQTAIAEFMENMPDSIMIAQLLSTLLTAVVVILYCKLVERRSLYSMGFVKNNAVPSYFIGIAAGFAMFSATLLISYAAGGVRYVGTDMYNVGIYVLYCVGWLLQGAEEEIVCRGYFMPSLSTKMPLWAAVLISSLFFSLMHLFNTGFNLIVLVNLTLTGIMFAVFAIRFDNLWVCCAVHSVWNLVQGNFYGLPVSGMFTGPTAFRFELCDVSEIWTGGAFGLEGSLSETIVMIVVIAAVTLIPRRKRSGSAAISG